MIPTSLRSALLIEGVEISDLVKNYFDFFFSLTPYVVFISVLVAFFTGDSVEKILMKTIGAITLMVAFQAGYQSSVDASLNAAASYTDSIISKIHFEALPVSQNKNLTMTQKIANFMSKIKDSWILGLVSILAMLGPFIAKVTYSFGYYITYIFFGLQILLFLLPNFERAMFGAVASWLWVLIFPHLFGAVLTLMHDEFSHAINSLGSGSIPIEKHILLIAFSFLLAVTPAITYGMVMGSGVIGLARGFNLIATNQMLNIAQMVTRGSGRASAIGGNYGISKYKDSKAQKSQNNFRVQKAQGNSSGYYKPGLPVYSATSSKSSIPETGSKVSGVKAQTTPPVSGIGIPGKGSASNQKAKIHPSQFDTSISSIPKDRMDSYKQLSHDRKNLNGKNSTSPSSSNQRDDRLLQKNSGKRSDTPTLSDHSLQRSDRKRPKAPKNKSK